MLEFACAITTIANAFNFGIISKNLLAKKKMTCELTFKSLRELLRSSRPLFCLNSLLLSWGGTHDLKLRWDSEHNPATF